MRVDTEEAASSSSSSSAELESQMVDLRETNNKLKRLMNLAKRSIEDKQRELVDRDRVVEELSQSLAKARSAAHDAAHSSSQLRAVLQRVHQDGVCWILVEYDDAGDSWQQFADETEMLDFIRRDTGEPLQVPSVSLSPEQSERLQEEARESVAKITEDFRRYRVRAEIARKQKDAQVKQAAERGMAQEQRRIAGTDIDGELRKARIQKEHADRLRVELEEQEANWRQAYEKVVKENEQLRTTGAETALAAQWRQRYEQCVREKDELAAKLHMRGSGGDTEGAGGGAVGGGGGGGGGTSAEGLTKRYQDLKDEYKMYRKRAMEAIREKDRLIGLGSSTGGGGRSNVPDAATKEYLKNIVLAYMTTGEAEVREHMESAIATVLQFSPEEMAQLTQARNGPGLLGWVAATLATGTLPGPSPSSGTG